MPPLLLLLYYEPTKALARTMEEEFNAIWMMRTKRRTGNTILRARVSSMCV